MIIIDINSIKKLFKSEAARKVIISTALIIFIYLLTSSYFSNHFFFNTTINGVDVSLKSHDNSAGIVRSFINDFKLELTQREGQIEEIAGQDIEMEFDENNKGIPKIFYMQNQFKWIRSLLKKEKYYVKNLFYYNKEALENKINELKCLNIDVIEPQDAGLKYLNGSYVVIEEVYGNKINKDRLIEAIEISILTGETKLDLDEKFCYENPRYTVTSDKVLETRNLLNKYISTKITYILRSKTETLDKDIINEWISVDEYLEAVINEGAVKKYVQELGRKYDTAGITRKFKTSVGKIIEVKGGFYGWKINRDAETKELLKNIRLGQEIKKEPVYLQRAFTEGEDEIGKTYVEINITRQRLWFYKNGKLIASGGVVTGNPAKGYSTNVGTYMLNYKEKNSVLRGHDYESKVTYWMPFNGNIGLHDASWRHSFGGNIYKTRGTHGCVNAPLYLAKTIFNNIEEGTPIICYEE